MTTPSSPLQDSPSLRFSMNLFPRCGTPGTGGCNKRTCKTAYTFGANTANLD